MSRKDVDIVDQEQEEIFRKRMEKRRAAYEAKCQEVDAEMRHVNRKMRVALCRGWGYSPISKSPNALEVDQVILSDNEYISAVNDATHLLIRESWAQRWTCTAPYKAEWFAEAMLEHGAVQVKQYVPMRHKLVLCRSGVRYGTNGDKISVRDLCHDDHWMRALHGTNVIIVPLEVFADETRQEFQGLISEIAHLQARRENLLYASRGGA